MQHSFRGCLFRIKTKCDYLEKFKCVNELENFKNWTDCFYEFSRRDFGNNFSFLRETNDTVGQKIPIEILNKHHSNGLECEQLEKALSLRKRIAKHSLKYLITEPPHI